MSNSSRRGSVTRVLLDINTQCDFLLPRGALPVANRAEVLPNIHRVMRWGRIGGIPIVSTLEAHRPGEATNGLPPHCVDHSPGQRKLPFTLMASRMLICGDNTSDLPLELFRKYQQVVFTKRDRDLLSNPKADRLLNLIRPTYFAVFGALTERCVKIATLGLISRRQRVAVVRDACGHWSSADGELALRQMAAKGAFIVTTEELVSGQVDAAIADTLAARPAAPEIVVAGNGGSRGNGEANGNGLPRRHVLIVVRAPVAPAPVSPVIVNGTTRRRTPSASAPPCDTARPTPKRPRQPSR